MHFSTAKGTAHPLGATPDKSGVNFSIFSGHATSVELLLFQNHDDAAPFQVIEGRQARPELLGIQHTRFFRPAGRLLCEGFGRFAHG